MQEQEQQQQAAAAHAARLDAIQQHAARLARADIDAVRREFVFGVPLCLRPRAEALLCDSRDLPALSLLADVCCLALPAALLLHCLRQPPHWLGACYLASVYGLFLQRFLLTLHYTQHRPLFRPAAHPANWLAPYLLAPLFGVPSGAYHLHHVVMHHVEENGAAWDASSTEPYQRDSWRCFARYWLRFALLGGPELLRYAVRRRRWALAGRAALSMGAYWWLVAWRLVASPVAALWTLLLPYLITSAALMFGNWSQHIFVDPDAPSSAAAGLAYNCVACPDNALTYNDGYHLIHHANSRLHWSEMPQRWLDSLAAHDQQDALVFEGIGFFDVGAAVMAGRLGWLARHVVPCGPRGAARSQEEWVALMKGRLGPVQRRTRTAPAAAAAVSPWPSTTR